VTAKGYIAGTHRVVPPEVTLYAALPVATLLGVTRCADVTGLDSLGIPVHCAIRPRGRLLQVANGKGCRDIDAKVSALMEAIEHATIEKPQVLTWTSVAELRRRQRTFADPKSLQGFDARIFYTEDRILPWVEGESLPSRAAILVPAPFVHPIEPAFFSWSTNGLASGNDLQEATLHALYEICERHALSLLMEGEDIQLDGCQVIETSSIDDPVVTPLVALIENAACRLILLRVDLPWRIHTFMAFLLDPALYCGPSIVNFGAGAHLSPTVAATRAITEAAQTRLTFIHGAREDLRRDAFQNPPSAVYASLKGVVADTIWRTLCDPSATDLSADYETLLEELDMHGLDEVIRIQLASPGNGIAVVKVAIIGSKLNFPLL